MPGKDEPSIRRVRVWDLPIRVFHWALVGLIVVLYLTAAVFDGYLDWHMYLGVTVGGLVVFRVLWGIWGSETARFAQFVPGPRRLWNYLRRGDRDGWRLGHNPLGALSVVVLLVLLAAQVGTGLFSHDDLFNEGPFNSLVSGDIADWLTARHKQLFYVLLGFIALHVLAVLFHVLIKRHDLLRAMITGWMRIPASVRVLNARLRFAGPVAFLLAAGIAGGLAWWVASMISTL
ncbi:cytochrome b/b6 domain-containing protein [Guyparkeria sp.]|uniref:cytochrome b/b6 domain-containing protein n=1 Tax=Guyparkeria sp. TaxID=2035736 RepID=UPI00397068CE